MTSTVSAFEPRQTFKGNKLYFLTVIGLKDQCLAEREVPVSKKNFKISTGRGTNVHYAVPWYNLTIRSHQLKE